MSNSFPTTTGSASLPAAAAIASASPATVAAQAALDLAPAPPRDPLATASWPLETFEPFTGAAERSAEAATVAAASTRIAQRRR